MVQYAFSRHSSLACLAYVHLSGCVLHPTLTDSLTRFLLTLRSQIYTWGAGENGRLGLGDESDKVSPKHVSALARERVKEVFAGYVQPSLSQN